MPTAPIIVDHDTCEGFGVCYTTAPELLAERPEDGHAEVRGEFHSASHDELVDTVVHGCPRRALSRSDES